MRYLASTLALAVSLALPTGPGYQVTKATGDHDFFFTLRQASKPVMTSAPDNTLSPWQPLPFRWNFFGREVRGYYVSDNGYITFDSTARASIATPTILGDPAAPRGSIFAFWSDLKMEGGTGAWTNTVVSATFGEAPNRTHVIYWMSVVPAGSTFAASALSFAIAIHEEGTFEVIYTAARKGSLLAGTVGALSLDGAASVLAAGPTFDFPAVGFGGEDDQSFVFKPIDK
jgi:hypothetical protein